MFSRSSKVGILVPACASRRQRGQCRRGSNADGLIKGVCQVEGGGYLHKPAGNGLSEFSPGIAKGKEVLDLFQKKRN